MSAPILATKLYIPLPSPDIVARPRLVDQLNDGLVKGCKLTLVSAPAGFGKTTLVSEWIDRCGRLTTWLSLDIGDNDPARFLTYLIAALQKIKPGLGADLQPALQSSQPLQVENILTTLINEIDDIQENFLIILDDYHSIDSQQVDQSLIFLLEHLPPQMHLVITTREDPHLPLARLRARNQMTELRAADLRFTQEEAGEFLNRMMKLNLSVEDIEALESRTEGWITGLQLAAISMRGYSDTTSFIQSFTGSHRFVLDYLVEEVLQQQPEKVLIFLMCTSILDRMCGPLCEAVRLAPPGSGKETLEYIEQANLFIVPLDNERRWYRYHHLFAELLRQRLHNSEASLTERGGTVTQYHKRASQWFEDNGLDLEAFQHAIAANDIERAARLIEGKQMPLYFRGGAAPILKWLESLPTTVLDARPSLWVTFASATLTIGLVTSVEEKVQAAEAALQLAEPNDKTRDLIGRIASVRATLAVTQHQAENIIFQAQRALEYLDPNNLSERAGIIWKLGYAHHLKGDRTAAKKAYIEALSTCEAIGRTVIAMMSAIGLGVIQEAENQLSLAFETYQRALKFGGDPTPPPACDAHLGMARIFYQWNDLESAQYHAQQSLMLARQIINTDRSDLCELFIARLMVAKGDPVGAAEILARVDQSAHLHNFVNRISDVAAQQAIMFLHQGDVEAAAHLTQLHDLPLCQVRIFLAQGDTSAALTALEILRQQMKEKGWADELLKVMILQSIALHEHGEKEKAVQLMGEVLALTEPHGFIRLFLDEGAPMAKILSAAAAQGIRIGYVNQLLASFNLQMKDEAISAPISTNHSAVGSAMVEPLSPREYEILRLIASGLSNKQIGDRLYLALDTVKGHNRKIFDKLNVNSRSEAIARAHELNLL